MRSPVPKAGAHGLGRIDPRDISQSPLPQCWLAPPRMNSPRQASDTACQARFIGTRAQVANVPVEPSPNGTLLTSDAPLAQTPISSQMVTYLCDLPRELPDECRTSSGEYCFGTQKIPCPAQSAMLQ